ncbi:MAG: hypothetical protein GY744_04355 [Gammaproteobacteria bacterium]|nr:hypothetical protein [Gammaproteobacteria bacterium]
MRIGHRASSETFADFTLSRVPEKIRDSLTDEQYNAIRSSLVARDEASRHSIDIRLSLLLPFRSYYFVFFAGRDRRASTYRLEESRWSVIPLPIRRALHYVISLCASVAILGVIMSVLYKLKSMIGIDIFPGCNIQDLLFLEWSLAGCEQG